MKPNNARSNQRRAFSFIEVSVITLIIAIAIGAISASYHIVKVARISSAQKQTANSVVKQMDGVFLWLETTLEESFIENEAQDFQTQENDGISVWHDLNPSPQKRRNSTSLSSANNPKYYTNCINSMPCLKFDGVNDYFTFDASELVNTDYAIFIVEQRRKSGANPIIGHLNSPTSNASIEAGYGTSNKLFLSQGTNFANAYQFTNAAITSHESPQARLHSFINSSRAAGMQKVEHHLNASNTETPKSFTAELDDIATYSDARIGVNNDGSSTTYFEGDIGEIIIFNKALSKQERQSVENYLLKKWHISKLE